MQKIIRALKQSSSVQKTPGGLFLATPNTYKLEFKNNYDKKIDLVISCVSEMNNEISEIILNTTFQEFAHIYDINYRNETNTHYKNISLKKNVSFNSGEGMLVEQAALSWGRWFGDIPDTSDVKARIENGRL